MKIIHLIRSTPVTTSSSNTTTAAVFKTDFITVYYCYYYSLYDIKTTTFTCNTLIIVTFTNEADITTTINITTSSINRIATNATTTTST